MKTDRPRLLVITSTYPRWANDNEPGFIHALTQRLVDRFEVTVIAPHAPGALRREMMDGVEVIRFRYAPVTLQTLVFEGGILANLRKRKWKWLLVPFFAGAIAWTTARILRQRNIHVMHAHWLVPQAWIVLAVRRLAGRRNVPVLATAHGADLFALRGGIGTRLKRRVLVQAEHVTVVSNTMADLAEKLGADRRRLTIAPMGVDANREFKPSTDGTRDNATILFVGRLVEKKGVEVLLHAFVAIRKAVPRARLRIIGEGPRRSSLVRLADSLGITRDVEFVGALPHHLLPEQFRRATLFVMPSVEANDGDQEGFGLVLIEAMACAAPIIASNYPAVHDIVTDDCAKLVAAGDSVQLAEACCALLADEARRQRMGDAAREHVVSRFDWAIVADRYSCLLNGMIRDN